MAKLSQIYDFLIIGSGAAGLNTALKLADHGRVALLSKSHLTHSSTAWAQGGIAAVASHHDSFINHIHDTQEAGAGLCHPPVVQQVVENAPNAVARLIALGVSFSRKENDGYHLTREGGHSKRRVYHVADATGRAIEEALAHAAQTHPDIDIFESHLAVDLILGERFASQDKGCLGAFVLDIHRDVIKTFLAKATVLATGGAARIYPHSTNPEIATGDGIAMGYRAGCRVANMEFLQFHPTSLYDPEGKSFLLSEALRGEGARLFLRNGQPFLGHHHPDGELAPRDVVARAIDYEMKRHGDAYVLLDISHKPAEQVLSHFPTIAERCRQAGYDITQGPVPVVPAAHYTCGGIVVGLHGETDIPRLYAVGETSWTGLHGANRLASNSLLECLVYSETAARHITQQWHDPTPWQKLSTPYWDESRVGESRERVILRHDREELQKLMWDYVGIVRNDIHLQQALRRIDLLKEEVNDYYRHYYIDQDLVELRNLVAIGELITRSALARRESRGLHYTLNHPETGEEKYDTIMHKSWCYPCLVSLDAKG